MKVEFGRDVAVPELLKAMERAAKDMGGTFSSREDRIGEETVFVLGSVNEETRCLVTLVRPIVELPFSDLFLSTSDWNPAALYSGRYRSRAIQVSLGKVPNSFPLNKDEAYSEAGLDITVKMVRVRRIYMSWRNLFWHLVIPVLGWLFLLGALWSVLWVPRVREYQFNNLSLSMRDSVKSVLLKYFGSLGTNLKSSSNLAPE